MLARLLKELLSRRARQTRAAPPSAPPSAAAPASPGGSRLALLSRLASLASGRDLEVTGKEAIVPPTDPRLSAELPVAEIIARAAALAADSLEPATEARVARHAATFERAARPGAGLAVFVFHADLPAGERIDYVDARFTPGDFDYLDILRRCIGRARQHCPGATVYLATAAGSRYVALAAPDVVVVELELEVSRPMYERAAALAGYARSAAFCRDTVFLDGDALVNRPLGEVFGLGFDLGLTYREGERLMPVNEGVMFLAARNPAAVRHFLERRLATYDRVAADPFITGYYGDMRRWRGGQLSLNALVSGLRPYSPYRVDAAAGVALRFLPCDTFNFAGGEGEAPDSIERLAERYVVHFKGPRKYAFRFAAMAESRTGG
jgi:hypothetical protein